MKIEDKLETIEEKQEDLQDGIELLIALGVNILAEVTADPVSKAAAKATFYKMVDDLKETLGDEYKEIEVLRREDLS